ncbi:MAG: prepilin-type N-terminal cleavage/methylation domain-containing protein [Candidatus Omnitrophica bacterium]|nr:prepilin-type N-terminal cleavage/methylation domain-containing protein [Candidatus Omnitrophota bacterium]
MNRKAFTLIELLIVIAILGILVALILPRFSDIREDANAKVCLANQRGLASAIATYETRMNDSTIAWGTFSPADLVTWGYVTSAPTCPNETGVTKDPYVLVSGSPDDVTCPNQVALTTHVWP